jgi:FixJ family two-component response regulator
MKSPLIAPAALGCRSVFGIIRHRESACLRGADMSARHRITVVDDDHSVRKALCRLLRSVDLDAEAYGSSREFLDALLRNVLPDCLVLDLRMPDMNGLELQRHLASTGVQLPTVIITGHDEPGMHDECMAAGASSYLRKPLDDKALIEAIDSAITEMRSRGKH